MEFSKERILVSDRLGSNERFSMVNEITFMEVLKYSPSLRTARHFRTRYGNRNDEVEGVDVLPLPLCSR